MRARVLVPQNGPISIAFNANGMDFYIHGVTGCTQGWCDSGSIDHHVPCDPAVLDHAVLIVGYGTQSGSACVFVSVLSFPFFVVGSWFVVRVVRGEEQGGGGGGKARLGGWVEDAGAATRGPAGA